MLGRITYTTTLASTPRMSPFTAADMFALTDVFSEVVAAGTQQDIFLHWGYDSLDPYYSDQRQVSQSAAGVVDIVNFGSTTGFKFSLSNIVQNRGELVNEYEVMTALNEELMNGIAVTWYPDYAAFPAEYYSCIAEKRIAQKRMAKLLTYKFDFDFRVLAGVQIPSTVPDFVMA